MMRKILLIVIMFFISSCGYKPIYLGNNEFKGEFNEITLEGDIKINRQIVNSLNLSTNLMSTKKLTLKTNYVIVPTSKDSKGQVETYRSLIKTLIIIKENKKIINSKNLESEILYSNKENKFELKKHQDQIKKNLTNKISEQILIILNLL